MLSIVDIFGCAKVLVFLGYDETGKYVLEYAEICWHFLGC